VENLARRLRRTHVWDFGSVSYEWLPEPAAKLFEQMRSKYDGENQSPLISEIRKNWQTIKKARKVLINESRDPKTGRRVPELVIK
jgi:translation initiation factor 2B subunit (eIF-2B alpha/beta/delta family)